MAKAQPWWRFSPFLLVVLAYAPALFYSFAHHDQYRYFRTSAAEKTSCAENTQFIGLAFDLGRPITAIIDCFQFKTAHDLSSLTWHRALTLVFILGFAFVLDIVFRRRWKMSAVSSGLLSAVICVIPGLLNQFVMSNQAVFVAHILATLGFLLFEYRPWRLLLTFLLFTVALFTYQPAAFLMVALAFADFLFGHGPRRSELKRLLTINGLALVGSALYYTVVKFLLHPYVNYGTRYAEGQGWGGATYAFSFSSDFWGRFDYFVRTMNAVLNFWNIYPSWLVSLSALALVIFLSVGRPPIKIGVAIVGLLASFAPLLAAHISIVLYRSIFVVSAYTLMVLVWLARENFKLNTKIKWALAVAALLLSSFNLFETAQNSFLEINFLAKEIRERRLLENKTLLIKNVYPGQASRGFNGLPSVADEFNVNSTVFYEEEVRWILRTALIEAGARTDVRVATCADGEDCTKAEFALRHTPNVYVISRSDNFTGYPLQFPIIDLEPFTR